MSHPLAAYKASRESGLGAGPLLPEIMRDDVFRIETSHLWLRWPRQSDLAVFKERLGILEQAELSASLTEEADRFILEARTANADGRVFWLAVTAKAFKHATVGFIELTSYEDEITVYAWIAPSHRRRGYMTQTIAAIIDAIFSLTSIPRIVSSLIEGSGTAQFLKKNGFAPVFPDFSSESAISGRDVWAIDKKTWENKLDLLIDTLVSDLARIRLPISPFEASDWGETEGALRDRG